MTEMTSTYPAYGTYQPSYTAPAFLAGHTHYCQFKAVHAATMDAWNGALTSSDPGLRQRYTEVYLELAAGRDTLIVEGCRRAWKRLIDVDMRTERGQRLHSVAYQSPAYRAMTKLVTMMRAIDPAE